MTISSTTRVAGPFTGSGSTATFPFTFKVFTDSDLEVTVTDANSVETTMALTTDYSVALNADQDTSPGGAITLTAGNLAAGQTLTITTNIAPLQGVELDNGGAFYPDVITAALDRLTILIQQLRDRIDASAASAASAIVERNYSVLTTAAGTTVTLPYTPNLNYPFKVFRSGMKLSAVTTPPAYTVSGNVVTFAAGYEIGEAIDILYWA
jgi:hypothetical protein